MQEYSNDIFKEEKHNLKEITLDINENDDINKPLYQDRDAILKQRNTVKILTYNFFSRPPPVNTNGTDYKNERLKDFLELLPNFDIICFQEIFTTFNDRKHRMIREGAKEGLKYYVSSKAPSFFSKYISDSGLLILSRYEIIENDCYDYYLNVSGDSVSNKGILYAKIRINDKYLILFNTHLQSSYFDESISKINCTIQVRTKQTEELVNYVYNKLLSIPQDQVKKGCVLIVGDFNIDAHDNKVAKQRYFIPKYTIPEYELLKQKFNKLGKAIDVMEKRYGDHPYTFGNNEKPEYDKVLTGKADFNLKQTLDYIWEIVPDYNLEIYKNSLNFKNLFFDNGNEENKEDQSEKSKVLYETLKVEEFLVKNRPYQQLSDHFGVSVELLFPKKAYLNS